jgi:hypothetical protein
METLGSRILPQLTKAVGGERGPKIGHDQGSEIVIPPAKNSRATTTPKVTDPRCLLSASPDSISSRGSINGLQTQGSRKRCRKNLPIRKEPAFVSVTASSRAPSVADAGVTMEPTHHDLHPELIPASLCGPDTSVTLWG